SEAPSDPREPPSVARTCVPPASDQRAAHAYDSGDLRMLPGLRPPARPARPATSARWLAPVLIPVVVALVAGGTLAPKPDGTPFTAVVGAILAWALLLVLITWAVGLLPLLVRRTPTAGSTRPAQQPASSAASWHRVRTALMVVSVFIL